MIHAAGGGDAAFQPYGRDDECNYSVSRRELNMFLLGEAEAAGATIKFGHKVLDVDAPDDAAEPTTLKFETDGGAISASRCFGPVVAADGGGSAIRRSVKAFSATEEKLPAGYKEMTFPKDCAASLDDRGLHIWPRGTHFLMGLVRRAARYGTFGERAPSETAAKFRSASLGRPGTRAVGRSRRLRARPENPGLPRRRTATARSRAPSTRRTKARPIPSTPSRRRRRPRARGSRRTTRTRCRC